MENLEHALVARLLGRLAERIAADPSPSGAGEEWAEARAALAACAPIEPDLAGAVEGRDLEAVRAIVAAWDSGERHLPEHDRTVLKRAIKSFRKSLKVTRLDEESALTGRGMSAGRESAIVGMTPPPHYAREVWDELVRQKRLLEGRHGTYELPPE